MRALKINRVTAQAHPPLLPVTCPGPTPLPQLCPSPALAQTPSPSSARHIALPTPTAQAVNQARAAAESTASSLRKEAEEAGELRAKVEAMEQRMEEAKEAMGKLRAAEERAREAEEEASQRQAELEHGAIEVQVGALGEEKKG